MRLAYLNRGQRRPRSSGASVEVDGAVGVLGEPVVGVVGAVVVPGAEQDQVLEGRGRGGGARGRAGSGLGGSWLRLLPKGCGGGPRPRRSAGRNELRRRSAG